MERKYLYIGGFTFLLIGGYVLLRRKKVSSQTPTSPALPDNNAEVAAQTANPNVVTVSPNGENDQGNYGDSSDSSYMEALAQESALQKQLSSLTAYTPYEPV